MLGAHPTRHPRFFGDPLEGLCSYLEALADELGSCTQVLGDPELVGGEVDPHLKGELYVELARRGLTLKAWFVSEAERLVESGKQPTLFAAEPDPPHFAPRGGERSTRGKS